MSLGHTVLQYLQFFVFSLISAARYVPCQSLPQINVHMYNQHIPISPNTAAAVRASHHEASFTPPVPDVQGFVAKIAKKHNSIVKHFTLDNFGNKKKYLVG